MSEIKEIKKAVKVMNCEDFILDVDRFEELMNLSIEDKYVVHVNGNIKKLYFFIHEINSIFVAMNAPLKATKFDDNNIMIQFTSFFDKTNYDVRLERPSAERLYRVRKWLDLNGYIVNK